MIFYIVCLLVNCYFEMADICITVWDHVIALHSLSLICIMEIPLSLQQTIQSNYVFIRLLNMFLILTFQ